LIDELVVASSFRDKGVGRELLDAAVEKCKQLGCSEVEVSTEFTNTKAKEFYKRCGFEERGVILEKDLL
jgi:ribosomal protein S18 acetylase RimI-like enzyme